MTKETLSLVAHTYCLWLRDNLPASGKPAVHDFEARASRVIDSASASDEPPPSLDVALVRASLEWLFVNMQMVWGQEKWAALALHALRMLALDAAGEVLMMIVRPRKALDSQAEIPVATTPPPPPKGGKP